ncbi:MAG: hypothetical protein HY300_05880 [Verrucomicrobia bacterium]|nr:hypothetical protein [Verrucomicrobiota bacterium]
MNADDFESRLARQPLRTPPAEWRAEILRTAGVASGSQPSTLNSQPASWWRELLWPCPQAWAALAGAWVIIAVLNNNSLDRSPTQVTQKIPAPSPEIYALLREQERWLMELDEPRPPRVQQPAAPPRPSPLRPHSEIRLIARMA